MAGRGGLWTMAVACGVLVAVGADADVITPQPESALPELQAEQVFIERAFCGPTLDAGTPFDRWKRLVFPPNATCQGKFQCWMIFELKADVPLATDVCVDYSRMQLFGDGTFMLMHDSTKASTMVHIAEGYYPLTEGGLMGTVLCVNTKNKLVIRFHAFCDQPLDQLFVGWMYVYVQSTATGSIYFVDGHNKHRYSTTPRGQPTLTLRSHVWANATPGSGIQTSEMRLSVKGKRYEVCLDWNPQVWRTVPAGVRIQVSRSYAYRIYVTFEAGDEVNQSSPECHAGSNNDEVMVMVSRDTQVPWDSSSWNQTQLLFDLRLSVNSLPELKEDNSGRNPPALDAYDFDDDDDDASTSFWDANRLVLFAVLTGGVVVIGFGYGCWRRHQLYRRRHPRSSERRREEEEEEEAESEVNTPAIRITGRQPAACSSPMMPRATPSAPQPTWNHTDDRSPPPVGATGAQQQPPPSYDDLFPQKK